MEVLYTSYCGVNVKNNPEQAEFARLICANNTPIVFCEGAAGTGKTIIAAAVALELKFDKKYSNLYYTRTPIQVGPQMGFLPGDANEKTYPYIAPLLDTLNAICRISGNRYNERDLLSKFEIIPVAFIRGRNLEGLVIVDEAQNLSLVEIQTLCTRVGEYGKIIFIGSSKQIDNPIQKKKQKCDFQLAYETLLEQMPDYTGFIHLEKSMRSPWCAEVDRIFEELQEKG